MQRMKLIPGQEPKEIYIILRVFNLGLDSMGMKIYVDPAGGRSFPAELVFEAESYTVTPYKNPFGTSG